MKQLKNHQLQAKQSSWNSLGSLFHGIEMLESRVLLTSILVNSTSDTASGNGITTLRDAIIIANTSTSPTTITFDPTLFATVQTITLNGGDLELRNTSEPTTITGPAVGVTISGDQESGGLLIDAKVTANISNLTVTECTAGGVFVSVDGNATMVDCTLSGDNTVGGMVNNGTATLTNCTFSNDSSIDNGGGISDDGTATLLDCTFSDDTADVGGGVYCDDTVTLIGCIISGCTAFGNNSMNNTPGNGGGLSNDGTATVTDCTFSTDTAVGIYNGGIISIIDAQSVNNAGDGFVNSGGATVTDSTISGNSGFGMDNSAVATLAGCSISHNGEAGIYSLGEGSAVGCSISLSDCIVSGNSGGGIANISEGEDSGSFLNMTGCTISDNTDQGGGGLDNSDFATAVDCTFSGNTTIVGTYGGAIFSGSQMLTLEDCTLSGNSASDGAAIYLVGGIGDQGAATIEDCSICGNTSTSGAAIESQIPTVIANTIVASNTGTSAPDASGSFASRGNNLIGIIDSAATGFISSDRSGSIASPLQADLGPLANNGGPTQTLLPAAGSPAVDAGSVALLPSGVATDERGLSRTVTGMLDIGAVESEAAPAPTTEELAFVEQPADGFVGTLAPIVINVEDSQGSLLFNDNSDIALTLNSDPTGAELGGTTTVACIGGVAAFTNLSVSDPGSDVLTANDASDTPATSASFALIPPVTNQLLFTKEPVDAVASSTIDPVTVEVVDANGNVIPTYSSYITITLENDPTGAALNGTTTVAAVNGVATFSKLSIPTPGDGYALVANDNDGTPGFSTSFDIIPTTTPPATALSSLTLTLGRGSLPPAVVAGAKLSARLPVLVTNRGNAIKGKVMVDIYADEGTSLDGNQVLVASSAQTIQLKASKSRDFNFNIKSLPSTLQDGSYHLLAEVVDPSGLTNVTATAQTVNIAAAFIQPTVSVGAVVPSSITSGKSGSLLVTVTNNGNVPASGVNITLSPSTDAATPLAGVILDNIKSGVSLPPGKSRTFRLHFKLKSGLSAGSYFPYVAVSLHNVNATAVGTTQFDVA
ncbi:MAG TPA: right-handed parallel beta-helix repeat-containing protein [Tepidisphaeraceae bacterium]|nr:right-handed parallel beta-helix repeat-containing protein [Tepidisphaeraceae bacterium]